MPDDIVFDVEQRTWVPSTDGPKAMWIAAREAEGFAVLELHRTVDTTTREDAVLFELSRPRPPAPPPDLTDVQRVVLTAVARLTQQRGWASTDEIRDRAVQMCGVEGLTFSFTGAAPWWGLEEAIRALQQLDLVTVEVGMAGPSRSGMPASTAASYLVAPTDTGRDYVDTTYPA